MRQRLGQHFLTNKEILSRIAGFLEHSPAKTVIEIGPGHGELTRSLLALPTPRSLILIEKDTELASALPSSFPKEFGEGILRVEEGDVRTELSRIVASLRGKEYAVTGNIPYYLTSFLFRIVGSLAPKPERCIFTIQREVAERVAAKPPHMNLLAASVQSWADASVVASVPKHDFSPPPKVDSATVLLVTHPEDAAFDADAYFATVRALFKQPRKTIINNMNAFADERGIAKNTMKEILASCGIPSDNRAQTLSVQSIKRLSSLLYTESV